MSIRYFLFQDYEFLEILQSEKDRFLEFQESNLTNLLVGELSEEISDYHIYHDVATGYLLGDDELKGYFMGNEIILNLNDYEEGYIKKGAQVWNISNPDQYIILDVISTMVIFNNIFYEISITKEGEKTWFINFWLNKDNGDVKIENNFLNINEWMEVIDLSFVKKPLNYDD